METAEIDPLTAVVKALRPLESADRLRTVEAAMLYLGEMPFAKAARTADDVPEQRTDGMAGYPSNVPGWLKQNSLTTDELDRVLHFGSDGTFDIHDVPGKSKKEKTLNTYVLTGLGRYLTTNKCEFDDALARGFCQTVGCYDNANHAVHLKDYKGPEITGDKNKGYTITKPGIRKGAALIKEFASAAK